MTSVNVYLQALRINDKFDGTGKSQDRGNSANGDGEYFEVYFNLQINHYVQIYLRTVVVYVYDSTYLAIKDLVYCVLFYHLVLSCIL